MAAIFTRTAKSSANESFVGTAIALIVGATFGLAAFFAKDVPTVAFVCMVGAAAIGLMVAIAQYRAGMRFLKSGLDWRVEVTATKLSWQSPVEKVMASFETPLTDIKSLHHIKKRRGGKSGGYRNDFTIELVDRDPIELSENVSGIDPAKVFAALEEQGLIVKREEYLTKAEVKRYHRRKWEEKRAKQSSARSANAAP